MASHKNETTKNAGFDTFQHWRYGDKHWETPVRDGLTDEEFKVVKGYNAIGMTDQALDFIGQHADDTQPFLLMLSLNPPHWQWDDAPEEFLKLYPADISTYRPNVAGERYFTDREVSFYRHYHAHISAVDRQLGRIMDALREQGIHDDTILIYTSDHGSSFGSNGVGSKANPYEESIRVPFLIRWPGRVPAKKISDHNLGTIDLYPTLCGLAGITPPSHCGGQDFSPVMLGRPGPDPTSQLILVNDFQRNYFRTQLQSEPALGFCPFRGVRTKRHTFVVNAYGDWLLYDNLRDPYQMRNLVDDPAHADLKAELRKELDRWLAKAEDPFVPVEWTKLPLPERIAVENRTYALLPHQEQWDELKSAALAPYLANRLSAGYQAQLQAACDRIYDVTFFGRYKALHNELHGRRRSSELPLEEIQEQLHAHEAKSAGLFRTEAVRIISSSRESG